jgi:hypothetical protein
MQEIFGCEEKKESVVYLITLATPKIGSPLSFVPLTMTFLSVDPTARMHACGGLMTAEKCLIPNIPKLEMVKVPMVRSLGESLPFFALSANSLTELAMVARPF